MTNSAKVTAILISGIAVLFAAQFGTIALRLHPTSLPPRRLPNL